MAHGNVGRDRGGSRNRDRDSGNGSGDGTSPAHLTLFARAIILLLLSFVVLPPWAFLRGEGWFSLGTEPASPPTSPLSDGWAGQGSAAVEPAGPWIELREGYECQGVGGEAGSGGCPCEELMRMSKAYLGGVVSGNLAAVVASLVGESGNGGERGRGRGMEGGDAGGGERAGRGRGYDYEGVPRIERALGGGRTVSGLREVLAEVSWRNARYVVDKLLAPPSHRVDEGQRNTVLTVYTQIRTDLYAPDGVIRSEAISSAHRLLFDDRCRLVVVEEFPSLPVHSRYLALA